MNPSFTVSPPPAVPAPPPSPVEPELELELELPHADTNIAAIAASTHIDSNRNSVRLPI
jgi:hypothetical protein